MRKIITAILTIALTVTLFGRYTYAASSFSDVPPYHSNYKAISLLADNRIILGYPDGKFRPNNNVTRAEFIAVLCRALEKESTANSLRGETSFTDVSSTHWASGYINYAYSMGIINGMSEGTFEPESSVTYEQVIKMAVAALGYSQSQANSRGGYPSGYLVIGNEIGLNCNVDRYEYPANRGTVAQIIYNGDFVERPVPPPQSYYESGDYENQFSISLNTDNPKYKIYYTVDGSTPTTSSKLYTTEIPIERSTTVKAIAVSDRGTQSEVVTYQYTLKKWDELLGKCDEIIAKVIKPNMTELEKEKAIHDYIVLNSRYDIENFENDTIPPESYTPYGLLVKGKGVCQSYAEATKMLLNMVGIECIVISGEGNGYGNRWGGHAWNIVKIDGKYYHLDVTWDDPVPDKAGYVRYNYFNISDKTIKKDHRWTASSDYCNYDMDLNKEIKLTPIPERTPEPEREDSQKLSTPTSGSTLPSDSSTEKTIFITDNFRTSVTVFPTN